MPHACRAQTPQHTGSRSNLRAMIVAASQPFANEPLDLADRVVGAAVITSRRREEKLDLRSLLQVDQYIGVFATCTGLERVALFAEEGRDLQIRLIAPHRLVKVAHARPLKTEFRRQCR